MVKNPELLRKRLDAKEKQKEQSLVVKVERSNVFGWFYRRGTWISF